MRLGHFVRNSVCLSVCLSVCPSVCLCVHVCANMLGLVDNNTDQYCISDVPPYVVDFLFSFSEAQCSAVSVRLKDDSINNKRKPCFTVSTAAVQRKILGGGGLGSVPHHSRFVSTVINQVSKFGVRQTFWSLTACTPSPETRLWVSMNGRMNCEEDRAQQMYRRYHGVAVV